MRVLVLLAVAAATLISSPQTFRSSVEAVRVDVLVTDQGRPVGGLSLADFEVRDNGVRQRIDAVTLEDVPLSVMFALDVSQSVADARLLHLKSAAAAAIRALKPTDRVALLTFNQSLRLRADWTADRASLGDAVEALSAGGSTDLNDAAFTALTLRDDRAGRSLVLLFTDGVDTAGWLPASAVLNAARRTDSVVYTVGLKDADQPAEVRVDLNAGLTLGLPKDLENRPLLQTLATETGGRMLYADDDSELQATFVRVVDEFKSRYLLTYSPENVATAGWHAIDVRVRRRGVTVSARRGYER